MAVASSCAMAALGGVSAVAVTPRAPGAAFSSCRRISSLGSLGARFAGLVLSRQKVSVGIRPVSASLGVVADVKVEAKVEEEVSAAVTTESVPRPKKIGKGVVRLRLSRLGRKKRPFYRIVATHASWRRDGKYIELLGHYNPLHAKDDLGIVVKADRIKYWLGVGAQPSDTVTGILHKVGILKVVNPVAYS